MFVGHRRDCPYEEEQWEVGLEKTLKARQMDLDLTQQGKGTIKILEESCGMMRIVFKSDCQRGAWLAQWVECATLGLGLVSLSPMLDIEIT